MENTSRKDREPEETPEGGEGGEERVARAERNGVKPSSSVKGRPWSKNKNGLSLK